MTVKEIIVKYLKENGYDGLFEPDGECGCRIDDLIPCSELNEHCETGYKKLCTDCNEQECEYRHEKSWCIVIVHPDEKEGG